MEDIFHLEILYLTASERADLREIFNGVGVLIHNKPSDLDLLLTGNIGPAHQCFDPPKQLLIVNWLGHVIINAGSKAFPLVIKGCHSSQHNDRLLIARFPECPYQLVTVHPWHHNIHNEHIDMFMIQDLQCIQTVSGFFNSVVRGYRRCCL